MGPLFGPKKSDPKSGSKRNSPSRSNGRSFCKQSFSLGANKSDHTFDLNEALLKSSSSTTNSSSPLHSSHFDCKSNSSNIRSLSYGPNQQQKATSSNSNLYFLVITTLLSVFGILLAIGAIIFIAQLQTRVDILEKRCARYESIFDQLHRKLSGEAIDVDIVADGSVDLDSINLSGNNDENIDSRLSPSSPSSSSSSIDPLSYLSRRLPPIVRLDEAIDNHTPNGSKFSSSIRLKKVLDLYSSPEDQDRFDQFLHEVSCFKPKLQFLYLVDQNDKMSYIYPPSKPMYCNSHISDPYACRLTFDLYFDLLLVP